MPAGTKLVVALAILALALGVGSWWYRFESAHQSTAFWGPEAAELIGTPSQVTAITLVPAVEGVEEASVELLEVDDVEYLTVNVHDVTNVPGMVHLRHSLLTDSNYDWSAKVEEPVWGRCLQFSEADQEAGLLFTEDFTVVGLLEGDRVRAVDCRPMAETLLEYATSAKLFDASSPQK